MEILRGYYTRSLEESLKRLPYGRGAEGLETGIRGNVSQKVKHVEWDACTGHADIGMRIETPGLHRNIAISLSHDCSKEGGKGELRVNLCQQDTTYLPWREKSGKENVPVKYEGLASEISLRGLRKVAKETRRATKAIGRTCDIRVTKIAAHHY